jgi:predicted DNA-binding transcriptional regulator YafY
LLELYRLLSEVSVSQKNEITLGQIKDELNEKGELGEFDRRVFYRDLSLLNEITNLSLEYAPRSRAYIVKRKEALSKAELTVIINAILSARFDSESETRSLANKLYAFAGKPITPGSGFRVENRVKLGDDKDTLAKIDFIRRAIDGGFKILFDYQKYNIAKNYEVIRRGCLVSPYAVLWHNDRMYLVGNFEGNTFSHYRIERICHCKETNEPSKPVSEIVGYGRRFDEAEYLRKMSGVASGKSTRVVIKFKNGYLGDVLDAFGKKACVKGNGDGTFTFDDEVVVNKKLIHWILGFGGAAEAVRPLALRKEIKKSLKSASAIYQSEE